MKITIACVGKIKEKYLTAGIEEFTKRLQPFCKLETIAIGEERMPEDPSPALKEQVLGRETERLLAVLPENSYVILLDVSGKAVSSPELAAKIEKLALAGSSHITFVIGGAFGYTDALRHLADERISFYQKTALINYQGCLLTSDIFRRG